MKLNSKPLARYLLLPLLIFFNLNALALESDKEQPISIEADSVEIDEGTGISIYQGDVILIQGSIRITAARVDVSSKRGKPNHIIAKGDPVTFKQDGGKAQEDIHGKAQRAEYDAKSDTLLLIGNAELHQGKDSFISDKITYDRTRSVVKAGASAKGKGRVKVTIESTAEKQ